MMISGSMLTSVKMEAEEGCEQFDDYSFSILEGILPQVVIMTMTMMVMVMVMVILSSASIKTVAGPATSWAIFIGEGPGVR